MLVLASISVVMFAVEKKMWSLKIAFYEIYDIVSLISLLILSASLWSESFASYISATVAACTIVFILSADIYFSLTKKAYAPLIGEEESLTPQEIELSGLVSLVMMAPAYIMSMLAVVKIFLN